MARMYPRRLLEDEVKSLGETKVFRALEAGLDDGWEVFHSVGWVRRDPGVGARDGEIDFVLAHPEQGIVCVEVKGGDIECRHGEWLRRRDGGWERARDPFAQAVDHRYALERLIDDVPGWRGRDLLVVYAVALPDIPVHSLALAPDAPAELILDHRSLADVASALERVLAFHRGARERRRPPGAEGVAMLRDLLAPQISIEVPMAAAFLEEEQALVQLTRDQSLLLARMARNPRMAIYGCAGSGKTMLAVEHAKRLAADGQDVLFVCFNVALALHLAASERHDRITFYNFHKLCVRYAYKAGLDVPKYPEGEVPPEYFRDELPELFARAIDELGAQWDALIVDEAQDLHDHWLDALRYGLRDAHTAPVWLFLDDNQRIYEADLNVPSDFFRFELDTNCRTTQAIHRQLLRLYDSPVVPNARGPEGRDPELHHADDQALTVAALLERLLGPDDVAPADLVVLSSHALERSEVGRALGRRFARDPSKRRGREVRFSSIRAFKGLEAPVVLLCELEDLDDHTRTQQLYVGMSRARNHCVIVAPPAA
jgi:Nuclease-related domain/UvrD-like helicase C-terminal domain/AAA domain